MGIFNWIGRLIQIPGRLTSIAVEKVVCGTDEVYDDALEKRQSELNAQFKAVTDQEQIAINGGTATIASSPSDIVAGSGSLVTANAIAGYYAGFLRGTNIIVNLSDDITVSDTVPAGEQKTTLYLNDTENEITVTVPNSSYRTPDGEAFGISVPAGGYGEVSLLNIGGIIFARGC